MNQPRKKRITLRDVALVAHVSQKTVSNVINDWPFVSSDTRERVQRALVATGYRPSQIARSLVTGRTRTIGIIVPDIANPFFSAAFRGCEDALSLHHYSVFLCNTDEKLDKEKYYLESLVNRGVDGLILWGSRADHDVLAACVGDDLPVVVVDGNTQTGPAQFTAIQFDNRGGAEEIVGHLINSGRRRIAHLSGASYRLPAQARLSGYRQALDAANLAFDPALIVEDSPTLAGGYSAMLKLLHRSPAQELPDALFCYNDLMAIGAMAAAEELNLKIPADLAVVGFDDIAPAALVTPMLTTVRIAQYDLGQFAVAELTRRLQDPALPPRVIDYPLELKIRHSCGTRRISSEERRLMLRQLATSAAAGLPAARLAPV
ncbi:MAG: LacI family transcriptional regulator [Chloroflexota bacterium]|nr:LacI family transcriptional regulator [Chloroflexota bacterium]